MESMQKFRSDSEEYVYLSAMQDSLNAVLKIAEKFALKAESMLRACDDPEVRSNLEKIAKAARKIPACPPSSFYEGLCMLLFTREVTATLDGDGISQFGQVDKLLHPLYQKDIDAGTLTALLVGLELAGQHHSGGCGLGLQAAIQLQSPSLGGPRNRAPSSPLP